jgi:CRP/FNR family cyclic AMP-dependent transcriptional regulator
MEEQQLKQQLIDYLAARISLSTADKEAISEAYSIQTLKRKEFLFEQGEICQTEAFILSGTFRIFYCDHKGLEHVLYFAFKDWWMGDMASFNTNDPSALSAQALEKSTILTIDPIKKEALFAKVPALERFFRLIVQKHLTVLQKRFLLTVSATAAERYQELIRRAPGIEQLVPQHQIASYLGILPESFSRMKKQLHQNQKS